MTDLDSPLGGYDLKRNQNQSEELFFDLLVLQIFRQSFD